MKFERKVQRMGRKRMALGIKERRRNKQQNPMFRCM